MYRLMTDKPEMFVLRKMHLYQGECDWVDDVITVDYRREFISTLIHEVLHYFHPTWSETKVLREEKKIINALSVRQVRNVLKCYAKGL